MNTTTMLNVETSQDAGRSTEADGAAQVEGLKELADFELAYVGGGTANVIFQ